METRACCGFTDINRATKFMACFGEISQHRATTKKCLDALGVLLGSRGWGNGFSAKVNPSTVSILTAVYEIHFSEHLLRRMN